MKRRAPELILTCEHGGHVVPAAYRSRFAGCEKLLASHRGWDPGALDVARQLARATGSRVVTATTTRLFVDLNRSETNPAVFSERMRSLPRAVRDTLLARHHRPHWDRVRAAIDACRGPVIHVAVHSFTPVWQGEVRRVGVGLLYDPKRIAEREFAIDWQRQLAGRLRKTAIRRNAPYRGDSDGLATGLRREYDGDRYLGFELELNQRLVAAVSRRRSLTRVLCETLIETMQRMGEARHLA